MVCLEAVFLDADHFHQASTYRAGREEETTTLKFARVKGDQAEALFRHQ